MTKILCQHCPNIVEHTDTTCPECGGAIEPTDAIEYLTKTESASFGSFVALGCVLWFVVGCVAYFNGWFL